MLRPIAQVLELRQHAVAQRFGGGRAFGRRLAHEVLNARPGARWVLNAYLAIITMAQLQERADAAADERATDDELERQMRSILADALRTGAD